MHFKSFALASLAAAAVSAQSPPTLVKLLESTPDIGNLTTLVSRYPRLVSALKNATDITILAPSNEAFVKFVKGPGSKIRFNDSALIEAVLAYHVLQGAVAASDFATKPAFVPTLLDAPFANVTDGQVVEAVKNGTDAVIVSGLKAVSKVTKADLTFTGGVIHIIDTVLTIPLRITQTAMVAGLMTMVELLQKTGLATTVDETPNLTVFVPSNAAFKADAVALGKLDADGVANVLKAHVVPGVVGYSSSLQDGDTLKTLAGGAIEITLKNGDLFANGVKVIIPDVLVANGVVHVVEGVLGSSSANATTGTPSTGPPSTGPPSASGTGTGPGPIGTSPAGTGPSGATGSPIVPYKPNAASSVQAGWMGTVAVFIGAGIFLNA